MSEWTKQRLEQMIADGVEESLTLDYKSAASLSKASGGQPDRKAELVKDVTAFANSSGGVLIYGVAEYKDAAHKHLPERIDPIQRSDISKEWIDQIIQTIQPRIDGVVIHPVEIDDQQNTVCYVVEIQQSHTAHQARDHVYYKRQNFTNCPMEDYEVRDVMGRRTQPRVVVSARFVVYPHLNSDETNGALIFDLHNESDVLARFVRLVVDAPIRFRGKLITYSDVILHETEEGDGYQMHYSNHLGAPLFPRGSLKAMFKFKFIAKMTPEPERQISDLRYIVFADAMPKQAGVFTYEQILSK
jgi:hypothetical protein